MKINLLFFCFASVIATTCSTNLRSAEVSETDPVPNTVDDGGIAYRWTVKMGVKDRADLKGTVGAWSWDEDSFPETTKGWTHTSNWVALELEQEARVALVLQRQAGIPTGMGPTASNPDGNGLFNLFPGFSIYTGWEESGEDVHNFNNRGDIAWADEVAYYTHVENDGSHSIRGTFRLPAGRYSIVVGGNSPSTDAEGRQGYRAILTTDYPEDAARLIMPGGNRHITSRRSFTLKGQVSNPKSAEKLYIKCNGRSKVLKPKGRGWAVNIRNLREGKNRIRLTLYSQEGTSKDSRMVRIERIAPTPRYVANGLLRSVSNR